jgi:hypothetical protein
MCFCHFHLLLLSIRYNITLFENKYLFHLQMKKIPALAPLQDEIYKVGLVNQEMAQDVDAETLLKAGQPEYAQYVLGRPLTEVEKETGKVATEKKKKEKDIAKVAKAIVTEGKKSKIETYEDNISLDELKMRTNYKKKTGKDAPVPTPKYVLEGKTAPTKKPTSIKSPMSKKEKDVLSGYNDLLKPRLVEEAITRGLVKSKYEANKITANKLRKMLADDDLKNESKTVKKEEKEKKEEKKMNKSMEEDEDDKPIKTLGRGIFKLPKDNAKFQKQLQIILGQIHELHNNNPALKIMGRGLVTKLIASGSMSKSVATKVRTLLK